MGIITSKSSRIRIVCFATQNLCLIPIFSGKQNELRNIFRHLRKVQKLKWSKPYWSTILQSNFMGSTAEVYSAL